MFCSNALQGWTVGRFDHYEPPKLLLAIYLHVVFVPRIKGSVLLSLKSTEVLPLTQMGGGSDPNLVTLAATSQYKQGFYLSLSYCTRKVVLLA